MKNFRTLLALAFVSLIATSSAFAEGDKKADDTAKKDQDGCSCCTGEKAGEKKADGCTGEKVKTDKKDASEKKD